LNRAKWQQRAARLRASLAEPWLDTRGQALVEYLIVIGACALLGIAGFSRYGRVVKADLKANARHIEGEGLPSTEGLLGMVGADYNEIPGWCVKPNYCFAAGTPVRTETGDRAIESIVKGERIWARDVKTGAVALRPVLNTYRTPNVPVIDLELTASYGGAEQLAVTRGHLFWVEGAGWVRADALATQPLWSTEAQLSSRLVREEPEPTTVYNLEVAEFHSYFVGHNHVLVHNGDPGSCPDDGSSSGATTTPPPEKSEYCPPETPYKDSKDDKPGLCCKDAELKQCDCAAQVNQTGHELDGNIQINGEQVDIKAFPGGCGKDSCSSPGTSVNVEEQSIQDEIQKWAFTSMCGSTRGAIKPGAFITAQQKKPGWPNLSDKAQKYYEQFDQYCSLLAGKLGGTTGDATALHLSDDPDVKQALTNLLGSYKGLSPDEQKYSNQITNTGSNAYHTEPKAMAYLDKWLENADESLQGDTFNIHGTASPCAKCDKALAAFAEHKHITINYCFDTVYTSGPARGSAVLGSEKKARCSLAFKGCVRYSETGAASVEPQKDQKPLCKKTASSCAKKAAP